MPPVLYAGPGHGHRAVCGVCGSALAARAAHGERVELDARMLEDDRWTGCRSHARAPTRCVPPVRGEADTAGIAVP